MTWLSNHSAAEHYAIKAEAARKCGDQSGALALYGRAARAEERALDGLNPTKVRTLAITALSAASFYFKAQMYADVERVAHRYLATGLVADFVRKQLQELLQNISAEAARDGRVAELQRK